MTGREAPSPAELYQRIGRGLMSAAPADWVELRHTQVFVSKSGQSVNHAVLSNGEETAYWTAPMDVSMALYALRSSTYQPGKGAWYTAVCTVTSSGSISFDFDYDNEPQWDIDVVPATYVEDLEMFPRDEQHRPDWLKDKLRLAGA